MLRDLWKDHAATLDARTEYIKSSDHYVRLEQAGLRRLYDLLHELSLFNLVIRLEDGWLRAL